MKNLFDLGAPFNSFIYFYERRHWQAQVDQASWWQRFMSAVSWVLSYTPVCDEKRGRWCMVSVIVRSFIMWLSRNTDVSLFGHFHFLCHTDRSNCSNSRRKRHYNIESFCKEQASCDIYTTLLLFVCFR